MPTTGGVSPGPSRDVLSLSGQRRYVTWEMGNATATSVIHCPLSLLNSGTTMTQVSGVLVSSAHSDVRLPAFKSWLCHPPGTLTFPSVPQSDHERHGTYLTGLHVKHSGQCLTCSKPSETMLLWLRCCSTFAKLSMTWAPRPALPFPRRMTLGRLARNPSFLFYNPPKFPLRIILYL